MLKYFFILFLSFVTRLIKGYFLRMNNTFFNKTIKDIMSVINSHFNKITNDAALLNNIPKFLKSIAPLFHNVRDYRQFKIVYSSKIMGNIQHNLVQLFRNKKFNTRYLKNYMENKMDYNMFQVGTILNAIEAYIIKTTLQNLLDVQSFVAIDNQSPLLKESTSIYGFDAKSSELLTGQMHPDYMSVVSIYHENSIISLEIKYKDAKMYDSGVLTGRLTLKPELIYNKKGLSEYFTKNKTSLQLIIKNRNLNENHPCTQLLNNIETAEKLFNNMLKQKKIKITSIGDFEEEEGVLLAKQFLENLNKIILESMQNTEITKVINLGITEDCGRDEEFISFYSTHLRLNLEEYVRNLSDEDFAKIHNCSITSENIITITNNEKCLINLFPDYFSNTIKKSLDYATNT